MKSTYNNHHHTYDILPSPRRDVTERTKRRAEARKEQRALRKLAIRERMKANPRLVRA